MLNSVLKKIPLWGREDFRAEDRARTGHPDLGKVVLYQMSYFRFYLPWLSSAIVLTKAEAKARMF
jgi:hypothetical protein